MIPHPTGPRITIPVESFSIDPPPDLSPLAVLTEIGCGLVVLGWLWIVWVAIARVGRGLS